MTIDAKYGEEWEGEVVPGWVWEAVPNSRGVEEKEGPSRREVPDFLKLAVRREVEMPWMMLDKSSQGCLG